MSPFIQKIEKFSKEICKNIDSFLRKESTENLKNQNQKNISQIYLSNNKEEISKFYSNQKYYKLFHTLNIISFVSFIIIFVLWFFNLFRSRTITETKHLLRLMFFSVALSLITGLINYFILSNLINKISVYIDKITNNGFEIPLKILKEETNTRKNFNINCFIVLASFAPILIYLLILCFSQMEDIKDYEKPKEYIKLFPEISN